MQLRAAYVETLPAATADDASIYNFELTTWRAATKVTGITIGRRSTITDPGPIVITMPM